MKNRDRRLVRSHTPFFPRDLSLWIHGSWDAPEFVRTLVMDPADILRRPGCELLPTVPSTTVLRMEWRGTTLYFKYFREEATWSRIRAIWRGSRAYRAWQGSELLLGHGVASPQVIAVLEGRRFERGGASLVVTKALSGILLRNYVKGDEGAPRSMGRLAAGLGREIGRLHSLELFHGDLHPGNILVEDTGDGGFRFAFLDTERVRRVRDRMHTRLLKDLSLLNHPRLGAVSPVTRLRFFASYARLNTRVQQESHEILEKVEKASANRYGRKRHRGKK